MNSAADHLEKKKQIVNGLFDHLYEHRGSYVNVAAWLKSTKGIESLQLTNELTYLLRTHNLARSKSDTHHLTVITEHGVLTKEKNNSYSEYLRLLEQEEERERKYKEAQLEANKVALSAHELNLKNKKINTIHFWINLAVTLAAALLGLINLKVALELQIIARILG